MRTKVLGKFWDFQRVGRLELPRNADGVCDPPDKPGKRILVWEKLSGERELEVCIHEPLHAGGWNLAEEWVTEMSSDLARILWRLGYRRE